MQIDKQLIEEIISQIHKKDNVEEIFDKIEAEILFLLKAGRFTVYKRADNGREICSFYMSSSDFASPIILPITSSSIAGYVAQSEKSLSIADVYDSEELVGIHPHLSFDHSYDRESGYLSESMIAVPIVTTNGLEGVLQVLGYSEGGAFPPELLDACVEITDALATKFRSVLKSSLGPYQFLAEEGIISIEKLQEAKKLAQQLNKTLSYILKDRYELSTKVIANCLSDYYQVPFVNSSTLRSAPQSLMDNLNRNFLAGLVWVPIKRDNNGVRVAMEDPSNNELINEIRTVLKVKNVEVCVGLPEDILLHIGLNQFGEQGIATEDVENIIESISFDDGVTGETVADLMDTDATSIIRLVNKIITDAVRMNASDIHIEPVVDKPGIVRMRVDGICRKVVDIPENLIKAVIARVKILSNLDIAEKRKPQDGKMTVRMGGVPLELRIATLPVVAGESVVMRILQRGLPLSFNKLSLSERNETFIHSFLESSHGLILVVGPTGSGKTTTLHAILYLLNNEERKILTVEDPVEIVQDGLQQVQISPKAGVTFSFALRAFLRCDPDIILIGEMRDLETASIGIEASLTGHLVFSTLHTNSAAETVVRLLDMGLDALNFSDALIGIVSQRLARTLCSVCKEPYTPEEEEIDKLVNIYGFENFEEDFENYDLDNLTFYKPVGCEKCGNTGYRGRIGVHEVLDSTPAVKKLIISSTTVSAIRDQGKNDGMRLLGQDAIQKIFRGYLDFVMARKVGM